MRLMSLPQKQMQCSARQLNLAQPQVMGILNVTPDSFSDGGQHHLCNQAFKHAMQMVEDGASIIDIGGESTRPGAAQVDVAEEIRRVVPVVKLLAKEDVFISIDTSQPEVIKAAVDAGGHIWNDVRALTRPQALETAAKLNIPVVLMHMRGEPTTMNQLAHYEYVIQEVITELKIRIEQALEAGVQSKHIIIDPGFGFAKNTEHNLQLLQQLWQLHSLKFPILSGLSRKRFVGEVTQQTDAKQRMVGSVTGHLLSLQQGASIVRVHDVKATVEAIKIWQSMQTA